MTWEIALILGLLVLMLASFAWEKIPAELTALSGFATLIATGVLGADEALSVFSNPAPITVGAMFVLGAALERAGLIQLVADAVTRLPRASLGLALPALMLSVAAISAFVNNTPVVVMFLPVALALAKRVGAPASKMLIPLSYAAILGGVCTLVGTSTNLVVSGFAQSKGLPGFSFFELAWIGLPLVAVGTLYMSTFGARLLPSRETLTSILSAAERREYILEAFVGAESPLKGKALRDWPAFKGCGLRGLEVIRGGVALRSDPEGTPFEAGDRVLLAGSARVFSPSESGGRENLSKVLAACGFSAIAASEGEFVEATLGVESALIGRSLREANFRQRYRLTPIAIHRGGRNLRGAILDTPLAFGDTLLLLGTLAAHEQLRGDRDLVLVEAPSESQAAKPTHPAKRWLSLGSLIAVIGASASGLLPIESAAIVAAVFLVLSRCLSIQDAYKAIHWPTLFLIFAMLGFGVAMETSGATRLLAESLVSSAAAWFEPGLRPLALLVCITLVTTTLTEVLSNNAAAALMATLALGVAHTLGVDAKPFLIAVAAAASCSFATPIGYQTNTYVYGVGGYRFVDFLKVGIPLNIVTFLVIVVIVPLVWKF